MTDFTRRTNLQRDLQPVAITSVDPISRTATGIARTRNSVHINCAYATGDTITVPAVGEQWYVERFDLEWRLYGRIPFNDATLNIEPEEGQVSVGSASGPLELNGTEVRANGRALRLNGVYYRDSGTTLQRSEDGQTNWQPIFANASGNGTSGVLQMLANKLADIPITPAVEAFIANLTTEESTALTHLATWADGLGTGTGGGPGTGGWDLCSNSFFSDLRDQSTLTGVNTAQDEILSGFQNFINDLVSLFFCQYSIENDGNVTPTILTQKFTELQDFFAGDNAVGDFLRGLQNQLAPLDKQNDLLKDAVQGTVKFVQDLFGIFFCGENNTPGLDPTQIFNELNSIFDPLKTNPFLLGLQDLVVNSNREATNLLRDSTEGAVKFIETVFGVLNCNPAQPTPLVNLLALAGNTTPDSSTPLGILASIKKTLVGTDGQSGLLGNFWVSAFNGIAGRQGYNGNLLNNITDAFSDVLSFVFDDILGTLFPPSVFPKLDFKTIIKDFPNGFPAAWPTLQQWVDSLHLSDLLDPLHLGDWFKDNIFTPVLKAITGLGEDAVAFFADPIGHITQFFTNVRKFFGADSITNWLDTFGGGLLGSDFNPLTALQSFITTMLGNTDGTNVLKTLWDTLVDGLTDASNNFIRALTGRPIIDSNGNIIETGFGAGLKAIRDFFAGFGFDPANPTSLLGKIVKQITGGDGVLGLDDLKNFFDPTHAANLFKDVVDTITKAITGLTNPFANFADSPLKALFELFDPDNAANQAGNFLKKIVDTMVSATTISGNGPLAILSQLFSGITFTGATPKSLLSQLADKVNQFGDTLGISSIVANILGVNPEELTNSYNLTVTGSPTGGSFVLKYGTVATSAITYSATAATTAANIDAALSALTPTGASAPLGTDKITVTSTDSPRRFTVSINDTTSALTLYSASLTGGTSPAITVAQKFASPLAALQQFFSGFNIFDGTTGTTGTNLLTQVLSQAGTDIAEFVHRITGVAKNLLTDPLGALETFFSGFHLNLFNLNTGENNLIAQITKALTGGVNKTFTDLERFFTNLRSVFGGASNFLLPSGTGTGNFKLADAANSFISNLLSQATTALTSFIPAHALSNLGLEKITDLVKLITGQTPGSTAEHITALQTFFAGLTGANSGITKTANSLVAQIANAITGKTGGNALSDIKAFFGIGTPGGLLDFSTSANNTLSFVNQIVKAITGRTTAGHTHPLTDIASFLGIGPITDLNTLNPWDGTSSFLNQIVKKITGDAGTTLAHFDSFFKNLRGLLGFGSGTGLTPLTDLIDGTFLSGDKLKDAASRFVSNFLSKAGTGTADVTAAIAKIPATILSNLGLGQIDDLIKFLTGKDPAAGGIATDIQKMFANLRALFGAHPDTGVSLLVPATGTSFDAVTAANAFIKNLINQASNSVLNPAKILSVLGLNADGTPKGTLAGDVTARPLLTDLRAWLTTTSTNATEDIQKFFTNLQAVFNIGSGTGQVNLLPTAAFNLGDAQKALHKTISAINGTIADGTKWVTQTIADAKTSIDALVKALIGNKADGTAYTDLSDITKLFAGLNGSAVGVESLIHKLLAPIIGTTTDANGNVIAKTIADLQNFFSGFNTTSTTTGSIAHKIAQTIGGSTATTLSQVQIFFSNLHTFLGLGTGAGQPTLADFLTTTFSTNTVKLKNTIDGFIKSLNKGSSELLSVDLLPKLDITKIKDLVGHLTGGSAAEDVQKFFTNLRTFIGSATGTGSLLTATTDFSVKTAVEHFIENVLKGPDIATKLVTLTTDSLIDSGLIPNLEIKKIKDLISHLTGTGTTADDVKNFFTNLRGLFGTTSFLVPPPGTSGVTTFFNQVTAANQFVVNVLSKATTAGVGTSVIPAGILADFTPEKIVNLAKVLTGQSLGTTTPTGDLAVIQKFFSGFSGFAPDTGANNLVHQITNSIFGANGTLANLKTFFSGFQPTSTADAFNLTTGANTLGHQITKAITGTSGLLTDILGFFGIGATTDTNTLDPLTATNTLLNQIVKKITGDGSTLVHLNQFFANLRTAFGFTTPSTLYSPTQTATSLQTTIFNVIKTFNAGTVGNHALISQDKLKEWLSITPTDTLPALTQLNHFFANIKTFFGGNTTDANGKIDLLSGPIAISTAIDNFIRGVVNKGTNGLLSTNLLPDLDIAKIKDLIGHLTGKTGTTVAGDVKTFFDNIRTMLNHGTGTGQTNFNATQTADTLQKGLLGVITTINTQLGTALNALVSHSTMNGFLGGTAATDIKKFFDNLKTLFGGPTLIPTGSTQFDPSIQIGNFFGVLNNATTGLLLPGKVASAVAGGTNLRDDVLARPVLTDLTDWITNSSSAANQDIRKFFTNLQATLGNPTLLPTTTFDATAKSNAQKAIHDVVSAINSQQAEATRWVTQTVVKAKADIDTLVKAITGGTGTYGDLSRVSEFFGELSDYGGTGTGTTFINQLVKGITGGTGSTLASLTDMSAFFTNLRGFLNFNPASGYSLTTAVNNFFTKLNTVTPTTKIDPAKLLDNIGITQISNLVSHLTGGTGTGSTDLQTYFTNLRSTLGLTGLDLKTAVLTGDPLKAAQKAIHDVVSTINAAQADSTKWATQTVTNAKASIAEVVQKITGTAGATDLSALSTFFNGLNTAGTSLVSQFVAKITGSTGTLTDLGTFFTNFKSIFSGINLSASQFSSAAAANTLVKSLLDNSGLVPKLNNNLLTISGAPTGGSYRLSYGDSTVAGNVTGTIGYDSGATTIQSALQDLSSINTGEVTVTQTSPTTFEISINNLSSDLRVYSKALTGGIDADVTLEQQLDTALIPKLNVDWIKDLEDWAKTNLIEPLVSTLRGATGDTGDDDNGLTGLGAWAASLLTGGSKVPAENLDGTINDSLLGVIPVSNISNVSPNLLTQGGFAAATNLSATDDWSWDDTPAGQRTGKDGSAKLSFSTAGVKEMFSQQKIPVAQDDNLTLSAYVKTSGITNGTATYTVVITGSPTAGTFRLTYGGQTTSSIAYNAPTSVVAEALNSLPAIGDGGAIVSGTAGSYYTVSINNLASTLTATTNFFGPRVFNLNISGSPVSGTYDLSYNGSTTATALAYKATAATIQTELGKLPTIGTGNATVTGSGSNFLVSLSASAPNTLGATSSALTTRTHTLSLSNTPTSGTFTLTYGSTGVTTTPALAYNITPASLQDELAKLDAIGTTATVTGTAGSSYTIRLDNQASTLAVGSSLLVNSTMPGISVAPVTTTTPTATVTGSGTAVAPYLVTLSGSPTGSTFTLSYGGYTTQGLGPGSAPAQVQTALELLPSLDVGKVTVGGTAGSYSIVLTVATSTLTAASALTDSDYTVTLTNTPTSGTFTLTYGGQTTTAIAYNAPATGTGSVQAALGALSNVGASNVTVTGTPGAYTVAFKVLGTLTANATALRNATSPLATLTVATTAATLKPGGRYTVAISGAPTAGTFKLGYGGQTTGTIDYNDDAAAVRTALEALTTIGTGNVIVTAITGGFTVDIANYTGTLSLVENSLTSATVASVAITNNHRTPTGSNIFAIVPASVPNNGTFTLNYGGATTTALQYSASATDVQNALTALTPIGPGNATVTGSQGAFTVTIKATKRTLTATDTFMSMTTFTPGVSITETAPLAAVTGGSYALTVTGSPTGGSYTLTYNGKTTASIAYNADAATVRAALESLSTIGVGKVGVTGTVPLLNIAITGETATLAVNSSALTGGTSPKVTVEDKARPLMLSLVPYNGTTQLSTATVVTARPVAAWTQITGTWTVPANVTSVFTRLAFGGTATAGNAWFDDVSLTKTGLMQQGLVDRLVEGWQGIWDGAFGTGGTDKTSDDVKDVLGFVSGTANNGVTNAAAADGKAQTIADGVHEAMTGETTGAPNPGVVKTLLQGLNLNLFGQNTLGTELTTSVVPDITAGMSTDLRGVFNNVVLGLSGKADTTINGTNLPGLADIFKTAKSTSESITTLSTALTELQNTATNQTNSGKSDYADFASFVPFNNNTGLLYSGTSSSALVSSGGQAVWQINGQGTRWAQGVLTRTATSTNWQKVGVAFATGPEADWLTNANAAYNYILGRVNNTYTPTGGTAVPRGQHYVFAKFSKTGFSVGYTTNGTAATPTETLFPAPTGQASWPVAHEFTPGAVYYLECGTENGATIYRVTRNGTPLATVAATAAYPYTDADHRFSGFKVQATSNNVWTNKPGAMAAFAVADNTPAEYIGSGFRRFRSASGSSNIVKTDATGYSPLPNDFFNGSSYATPDYSYTATGNKITVANTGWYQVTVNLGLQANTLLSELATTLSKNGVVEAKGTTVSGTLGSGPTQCGGVFTVYLEKGDYIQPGIWQSIQSGAFSAGDSTGLTSYLQVTFLNRSTAN